MPIEGPLRELGIHDVFQLLDLSRKTGTLRVTSELRDEEGLVWFDGGKVLHATLRTQPTGLGALLVRSGKVTEAALERGRARLRELGDGHLLGEVLVEAGALTARDLERQVRQQIESVVFELMSWREGFFSFREEGIESAPAEARIRISTESLLMEGARRIDEWSRIADKVPHLGVVPVLASVDDDHPSLLDLLPNEWEVLTMIDGQRDLRALAQALGRSDFDIAKIAYGLATTGVVAFVHRDGASGARPVEDPRPHILRAGAALDAGRLDEAHGAARQAVAADPKSAEAHLVLGRTLLRLERAGDACESLARAVHADPLGTAAYLELGFAEAKRGDFARAIEHWRRFLEMAAGSPDADRVRTAIDSAIRLRSLVEAHVGE
jgi:tetratricopeptide (TPR) repeat protein